jgi:hypothetical protein
LIDPDAMQDEGLAHLAVSPAIEPGPIEPGVTMVLLTESERDHLLSVVGTHDTGPAASARLKLRAAAPVRDAGWAQEHPRGLFRFLLRFMETDGRMPGRCRWCKQRTRIDQYALCPDCLPARLARERTPSAADIIAHEGAT